jgi:hypothetical protein
MNLTASRHRRLPKARGWRPGRLIPGLSATVDDRTRAVARYASMHTSWTATLAPYLRTSRRYAFANAYRDAYRFGRNGVDAPVRRCIVSA